MPTWTDEQLEAQLDKWKRYVCPADLTLSTMPAVHYIYGDPTYGIAYALLYKTNDHTLEVIDLDVHQANRVSVWMKERNLNQFEKEILLDPNQRLSIWDKQSITWCDQPMAMYPSMEAINGQR